MARIIDVIDEREPPAVFRESTISDRYVRGVADDTDKAVVGPLFVDSLGRTGTEATSHIDMLRANTELLVETLGD